jgi:hypothetical protein
MYVNSGIPGTQNWEIYEYLTSWIENLWNIFGDFEQKCVCKLQINLTQY